MSAYVSAYLDLLRDRQAGHPYARAGFAVVRDGKAVHSHPDAGLVEKGGVDEKSMCAKFLITSAAKDRHGDVVMPDGCKDSLAEYAKNPVVLLNHNQAGLPVATTVDAGSNPWLDFTPAGIVACAKFHGKTRESDECFALVAAGVLRGASIGFKPVEAQVHEGKSESFEDDKVVKFEPWMSFTFLKWSLLEWSVVAVPANAEAVRLHLDKGLGGKALCDPLRQYLEPFAVKSKVWTSGFNIRGNTFVNNKSDKRAPHKPGEKFIRTLSRELTALTDKCLAAVAELDHPAVCDIGSAAAEKLLAVKEHVRTKGEKVYDDVDFDQDDAPPPEAPNVEAKAETPAPESVDETAVLDALKRLAAQQEAVANKFRRATGK